MNKSLGDILKNSISAEERVVQKKSLTLEEKISMVDQLNNVQHSENSEKYTKIKSQDKTIAKTFTFKNSDLQLIDGIINKYLNLKEKVNKSEVLKIGLFILSKLTDEELRDALNHIDRLTPGKK